MSLCTGFFLRVCVVLLVILSSCTRAQKVKEVLCTNSASGQPYCVSGATVTVTFDQQVSIDGTKPLALNDKKTLTCTGPKVNDKNVTCTLNYESSLPLGEYPINITLTSSGGESNVVRAGYLLIGSFYEMKDLTVWSEHEDLQPQYLVAAQSSTWPSTNDIWYIYGNFKPGGSYQVKFFNTETNIKGSSPGMPSCTINKVTANAINCTLGCQAKMMGMYQFLVFDEEVKAFLPGSTQLDSIAINPSAPTVEGKPAGDCATSSAKCVSEATLTFTGNNFNSRDKAFNLIYINSTTVAGQTFTCVTEEVTDTKLVCKLTIGSTTIPPGTYAVYLKVQVCDMGMLSPPVALGHLVLGGGTSSGWLSIADLNGKPDDVVTALAPTVLRVNNVLTVVGSFDPTAQYSVVFSQTLPVVANFASASVRCDTTTVDAFRVACTYVASPSYKKLDYYVLVQNLKFNNFIGNGSRMASAITTLYPANITVSHVGGDCATQSDKCVDGAELHLAVEGVAPNMPTDWVTVTLSNSLGGECNVKSITSATITCQLKLNKAGQVGAYPLTVTQRVSDQEWLSPVTAGFLVFGAGPSRAGWIATASDFIIVEEHDIIKKANKAAVAFAVIFAVLFLGVLIGLIIMCCKVRMMKRRVKEFVPDTLMYTDRNSTS